MFGFGVLDYLMETLLSFVAVGKMGIVFFGGALEKPGVFLENGPFFTKGEKFFPKWDFGGESPLGAAMRY